MPLARKLKPGEVYKSREGIYIKNLSTVKITILISDSPLKEESREQLIRRKMVADMLNNQVLLSGLKQKE